MLVLTRKQAETIVFPTLGVTVEVVRISPSQVRLGIQAPREIAVCRQEVAERRMKESTRVDDVTPPALASA